MILGTALIETGAVYPLTITGGSVILAALVWQSVADYRRQVRLAEELEKAAGGRVRRPSRAESGEKP